LYLQPQDLRSPVANMTDVRDEKRRGNLASVMARGGSKRGGYPD